MVIQQFDISNGAEFEIVGTALDIARAQEACKRKLRQLEEDRAGLTDKVTVTVPERDRT